MIEILLDDHTVNCYIVAEVFLLSSSCSCRCTNELTFVIHWHVSVHCQRPLNGIGNTLTCHHSLMQNFLCQVTDDLRRLFRDQVKAYELAVAWCQDLDALFINGRDAVS